MPSHRIHVGYQITDATQGGAAFAKRLVADLRTAGAEMVDERKSVSRRDAPSSQGLAQWFILVQTPEALQSLRVQTAINAALTLFRQKQVQGMRLTIATPSDQQNEQHNGKHSLNYAKAQDIVLLEINLTYLDDSHVAPRPSIASKDLRSSPIPVREGRVPVLSSNQRRSIPRSSAVRQPRSMRVAALALVLALVIIIAGTALTVEQALNNGHGKNTANNSATTISKPPATHSTAMQTVTATPNIYLQTTKREPDLNDPLNSLGKHKWSIQNSQDGYSSCVFKDQAYHAISSYAEHYTTCTAQDNNFTNFTFQVQMSILKGDAGGLVFRSDQTASTYYTFYICTSHDCGKGYYRLDYLSGKVRQKRLRSGPINTALPPTNLTVVVHDCEIDLYVNDQRIDQICDKTLTSGEIGVLAYDDVNLTEVAFSDAKVWKQP